MTDPADAPAAFARRTAAEGTTRRTVLQAAGLVTLAGGVGATLAACSSNAASSPATSSAPATSAAASASATAASSSAASPSAASSSAGSATTSAKAKAPSGPSVAKADVAVGGGAILLNADYVVTQPKKGTYKAFSKICTHQGCPVQAIVNHEIVCKCHNSHFSIDDGSVLSGPAQKPLPAAKTTVSGDKIVITS